MRHCSRDRIGLSRRGALLFLALLALRVHTSPWCSHHVGHCIAAQLTARCARASRVLAKRFLVPHFSCLCFYASCKSVPRLTSSAQCWSGCCCSVCATCR